MMCFVADGLKKFPRKVVLGNITPMRFVFPGTFSQFLSCGFPACLHRAQRNPLLQHRMCHINKYYSDILECVGMLGIISSPNLSAWVTISPTMLDTTDGIKTKKQHG